MQEEAIKLYYLNIIYFKCNCITITSYLFQTLNIIFDAFKGPLYFN